MPTDTLREPRSYGHASKSTGPEIPQIEDDNYRAMVKDVKEGPNKFTGGDQWVIEWELLDEKKANGQPLTLRSYLNIPDTLLTDGVVNENSKLYELLRAFGFGDEDMEVEPADWNGRECRIVVKNSEVKEGDNKGQMRPKVTGYLPPKGAGKAQAEAATARREQPAARKQQRSEDDF